MAIAVTRGIWYLRLLAGAMTAAALAVNGALANEAASESQSRIRAGIDHAVEALGESPRLKRLSPAARKQLVEFAVGNTLFVLAHEMGHILIAEMGLPVLGREEDAADSFVAVMALEMRSAFSERVLMEAAKGWMLSSIRDKKEGNELAFYDEHGLDLQRAYNVVCMMVGADPEKFKSLATETKLPQERQASCVRDYKNAAWSWGLLLKPHRRAADQPKVTINVVHKDDEKYAMQAMLVRHTGLLETLAARAADQFSWPAPFSFEARACGEPNARWDFRARTMTLCYELVEEFTELFRDYSGKLPRSYRLR